MSQAKSIEIKDNQYQIAVAYADDIILLAETENYLTKKHSEYLDEGGNKVWLKNQ